MKRKNSPLAIRKTSPTKAIAPIKKFILRRFIVFLKSFQQVLLLLRIGNSHFYSIPCEGKVRSDQESIPLLLQHPLKDLTQYV
jgi:hypothetical protein